METKKLTKPKSKPQPKNQPAKITSSQAASQRKAVETPKIAVREIDATGKVLGRLSTEVATILRGKDKPSFQPYLVMGDKVVIHNASKIVITGKKLDQKVYQHPTGYLGNLKTKTMKEMMEKNPAEVLIHAISGMLPKNKLRPIWLKNLEVHND